MRLSPTELIVILVIIVLLFGAKKLPDLAKSIGQSMKIFRQETQDPAEQTQPPVQGQPDPQRNPTVQASTQQPAEPPAATPQSQPLPPTGTTTQA